MNLKRKNSGIPLFKWIISIIFYSLILIPLFSHQTGAILKVPPKRKIIKNGLTLITNKDKSSEITAIQVIIKGGKSSEPEGKSGLSYLTTRLAIEIPDRGKIQDLMGIASRLSCSSEGDYSLINIMCLSENLEETLKIATKIMLNPLYSGMRIDGIKKQMLYRRKMREDDPIIVGHNTYLEKIFGSTAYGESILGNESSLEAIKKDDIKIFYENHFKAVNMIVVALSDLDEHVLVEVLSNTFNKIPEGNPVPSKSLSMSIPERRDFFVEMDTEQSFVSLAFPLPKLTPKNFILAYMVENLLGKGISSRLWNLRSKEKLAYNVNCSATQMKEGGFLKAYLETDLKQRDAALKGLIKIIDDLYENGITEEELKVTKIHSKAFFMRNNETKENRARSLAEFEALGLGFELFTAFSEEIDSVQLEKINAYLKNILKLENRVEVIVGPARR